MVLTVVVQQVNRVGQMLKLGFNSVSRHTESESANREKMHGHARCHDPWGSGVAGRHG